MNQIQELRLDVGLRGEINMVHRGADGEIKETRVIKNLVVTVGKAEVAGLINEATSGGFKYIGIGTGTTAAVVGNTAIETEITTNGGARALATTLDRVTVTTANDTARAILTYAFTGSFAVTEAGLLDAVSSGILLARQVFLAINVVSADSLQITWKITVA